MSEKEREFGGTAPSIDKVFHLGEKKQPSRSEAFENFRRERKGEMNASEEKQNIDVSLKAIETELKKVFSAVNTQNDAVLLLRDEIVEIKDLLKAIDAHEIRKVAERLLSKSEAEDRLEERLRKDRLRKNKWAEKQRGE